jgi:hypothetical protein
MSIIVSVSTNRATYAAGSTATIKDSVTANTTPFVGSSVIVAIRDLSGTTMQKSGITDVNSNFSLKYKIGPLKSTYTVSAVANASGFGQGIDSKTFSVR